MKLLSKTMALSVLFVASLGAAGCSTAQAEPSAIAPEETPATAPVEGSSGTTKDARFFRFYAPVAPPAARVEVVGVAPSPLHFWAPGYYRWTGREHVWVGGSWVLRRPGFDYVGPAWRPHFGRFQYFPGHWVRR